MPSTGFSPPESRTATAPLRSSALNLSCDPAGQRRAWGAAFAPYFDVASAEADPAPGAHAMTCHRLGVLTLFEMTAPAQTLRRTPAMAAGPGQDGLMVLFWLEGDGRVAWPGGEGAFARLQGVVLDLAQSAVIAAGPARATGLLLPRALVADQVPNLAGLHGLVLDLNSDPVSRLFFTCIQELVETANGLGDDQLPQIARAVATLGVAAFRRRAVETAADERRLTIAIRRSIHAELDLPDLSSESVAERFGLSRAGLYRRLSDEGGVERFIREQRLGRAMAMSSRPRGAGRSRVSSVAYVCGFSDETTVSRTFERRFGLLPNGVEPPAPACEAEVPVPPGGDRGVTGGTAARPALS